MQLSAAEEELVERVAATVVARRMTVPAVLFLESVKPVAFVGAHAMHALTPLVAALGPGKLWRQAAELAEDRDKLEEVLRRIERHEADRQHAAAAPDDDGGQE